MFPKIIWFWKVLVGIRCTPTNSLLLHYNYTSCRPYIYDIHTGGGGGGTSKFVTCLRILLLIKNRSIGYFCRWSKKSQNWSFFVDVNVLWPLGKRKFVNTCDQIFLFKINIQYWMTSLSALGINITLKTSSFLPT